jgi:hypothetical protein
MMARFEKGSTPKLTKTLIEEVATSIRSGCYMETAAALSGISKQTLYRWFKEAQEESAPELLIELSDAVKKAMAQAEARDLAVIDKAAQDGVWQAAAWRLERKHPDRWGRQDRVEVQHSGLEGKPIEILDRTETLKKILTDPAAIIALETLEAKLSNGSKTDS